MRAADQGLWRHLEARLLELSDHRGPRDRARARRPHAGSHRHRRDRVGPRRRAARSEGESLAKALAAIDAQVALPLAAE
jgi:hypothetical protein